MSTEGEKTVFDDNSLLTTIFNAIPSMTFVVDADIRLLLWNTAAGQLLGESREVVYRRRGGDVLRCVHASENPGGCGHAEPCRECVVRGSVGEAMSGNRVFRKKTVMELRSGSDVAHVTFLITAAPFEYQGERLCLLIIEDISELFRLRSMLPICAGCKKIRNDKDYWESVEHYIKAHIIDVDFSHGLCPDCAKKLYPEVHRKDG